MITTLYHISYDIRERLTPIRSSIKLAGGKRERILISRREIGNTPRNIFIVPLLL